MINSIYILHCIHFGTQCIPRWHIPKSWLISVRIYFSWYQTLLFLEFPTEYSKLNKVTLQLSLKCMINHVYHRYRGTKFFIYKLFLKITPKIWLGHSERPTHRLRIFFIKIVFQWCTAKCFALVIDYLTLDIDYRAFYP